MQMLDPLSWGSPGAGQVHGGRCSHLNHNFRRHPLIVSGRYRLDFNPFGKGRRRESFWSWCYLHIKD